MFSVHGHRGCRAYLPENTIPAFLKAAALGCQGLEMDVVISQDHQVVVAHEPWLNPEICLGPQGEFLTEATGRAYNLYQQPYAQIQGLDCGSLGHPRFSTQRPLPTYKPTLAAVIDAVEAYTAAHGLLPIRYTIEIKYEAHDAPLYYPDVPTFIRLVLAVLREKGVLERSLLQSFDLDCLRQAKAQAPEVTLSLLTDDERPLREQLEELGFVPPFYGPNFRHITPERMRDAQAEGLSVLPWTVNDAADIERLVDWGVVGVITDYPARALRLKKQRYQAERPDWEQPELPHDFF